MRSVFDVATDILKVSGKKSIPSITMQKMVFYAYGWYAYLTGQQLFDQSFYAMPKGPVVGDLLTAHTGQTEVDRETLELGREILEDGPQDADPYYDQVIRAIWDYYSGFERWILVDMTHEEGVWKDAWEARHEGSRRASLDIAEYFMMKRDVPSELLDLLPDPTHYHLTEHETRVLEQVPHTAHQAFLDYAKALSTE